jgi:DNA-binding MarR family transcriptional regulator
MLAVFQRIPSLLGIIREYPFLTDSLTLCTATSQDGFICILKVNLASLPCKIACSCVFYGIVMPSKTLEIEVSDLIQSIGLLVRRVRAAAASNELSLTEAMVMSRLARYGPATTADLARAEGMKPQSMGTTIAALEESGMVERKPHPTDGRQVIIELTARGAAVRKRAGDAKRTWLSQAIAQLNEKERETLFKAGEIIKGLVEK